MDTVDQRTPVLSFIALFLACSVIGEALLVVRGSQKRDWCGGVPDRQLFLSKRVLLCRQRCGDGVVAAEGDSGEVLASEAAQDVWRLPHCVDGASEGKVAGCAAGVR